MSNKNNFFTEEEVLQRTQWSEKRQKLPSLLQGPLAVRRVLGACVQFLHSFGGSAGQSLQCIGREVKHDFSPQPRIPQYQCVLRSLSDEVLKPDSEVTRSIAQKVEKTLMGKIP